jgi:predicted transglutaminase-like cysteine proteinase
MAETGIHWRALVGSALLANTALLAPHAQARTYAPLRLGAEVSAPRGFVELCARDSAYCSSRPTTAVDTGDQKLVTAALANASRGEPGADGAGQAPSISVGHDGTGALPSQKTQLRLLKRINAYVNRHVRQRSDLDVYGLVEYWNRSGTGRAAEGDCEDIAIEKRAALVERGFPAAQLRFAVVYSTASGLHTVLIAATEDGDFVLDSRSAKFRRWNATPYRWLAAQDADRIWRSVDRAAI